MNLLFARGWRLIARVLGICCFFFAAGMVEAADPPPSADQVRELSKQPLTSVTWPQWRDYYVRLYYAYEAREPIEFYTHLREYVGKAAADNGGKLPEALAQDPVAWCIFASYLQWSTTDKLDEAETASRHALELGDPDRISSYSLAHALFAQVSRRFQPGKLSAPAENKLKEAERLLASVERSVPEARVSYARGQIAWCRGDTDAALPLLRQGALDHPHTAGHSAHYLKTWMMSSKAAKPFADTSVPIARQFPDNTVVQALHAGALFNDEQYPEAYDALQRARRLNETVRSIQAAPDVAARHHAVMEAIRNEKPRWFDSHPTYIERLAALDGFSESRETADTRPATSLLTDFTAIEERLTELMTVLINDHLQLRQSPSYE